MPSAWRTQLTVAQPTTKGHFDERGVDKLTDITPRLMEDFKSLTLQTSKLSTFNRYVEMVKAMLNRAVEWKHLKENPLKGFKKLKNPGQ